MLKIVLESEVLLIKFYRSAEIRNMQRHMIDTFEHLFSPGVRIGLSEPFMQAYLRHENYPPEG
jgi:hypothetical protein